MSRLRWGPKWWLTGARIRFGLWHGAFAPVFLWSTPPDICSPKKPGALEFTSGSGFPHWDMRKRPKCSRGETTWHRKNWHGSRPLARGG